MGGRGTSSGGGGKRVGVTPFTDEMQVQWISEPGIAMNLRAGRNPELERGMEEYIASHPPVTDRLYRGIELDSESDLSQFAVGSTIDMQGISSWSTFKAVALDYTEIAGKPVGVVFEVPGTRRGAKLLKSGEGEVIISKQAKWTVTGLQNTGDGEVIITLAEQP